jgi:hypothetical protein
MTEEQVSIIYNELLSGKRDKISFSKGYKLFEEYYKLYKQYGVKRKEISQGSWVEVIVYVER